MKRILLLLVGVIAVFFISCGNDRKKDAAKGNYSVEDLKPSFDPVHQYKDKDGNIWSKDNIWGVPRENESINDPKFQRKHRSSDSEDAYQKGYEDGMEEGEKNGYDRGYEDGSKEIW